MSFSHRLSFGNKGQRIVLLTTLFVLLSLSVFAEPIAGFKVNNISVNHGDTITTCIGTTLTFQSVAQNVVSIRWRFNNGTGGSLNSFTQPITYNTAGIDTAWQVVTDFSNEKDSMFVLVRVNNTKPVAGYSFAPNGQCANVPIVFSNTSTGTGLTYSWDFGDAAPQIPAGTSIQKDPSYQFLSAVGASGTQDFNVKLVVKNDQNCKDSITQKVTVLKIPDASISSGNTGVIQYQVFNGVPTFKRCENVSSYEFSFFNATTTPAAITGYTIKWGDNSPDSTFTSWPAGTLIKHTYTLGQHTMEIRANGTNGCIGIKKYNVFLGTNPAGGIASRGNTSICAPNALTFDLSSTENNAPGTTYTFTINDGSEPVIFQQPPPKEVTHTFLNGSCGTISTNGAQTFANSFTANLYVENPCGSTAGTVIPIYVSGKPRASIGVSPSPSICTDVTTMFYNTSSFGGVVNQLGGGNSTCTNTGKQVWVISPATGYTLLSGTLGSLNGNPTNGAAWTNGSSVIYPRFTTPGTYTVKLYIANDLCGMDSTIRTVCVRNPPTASFTMDKKEGCAPDVVTITNTTPPSACLANTFNWSIAYTDPSSCGGSASYTFLNGTNTTSQDPQIQFTSPGRYVITLTVNAFASGCASAVFRDTFYVKDKPKISLITPAAVCLGNTITPSATVSNCYSTGIPSYNWSFTNGSPSSSSNENPGLINYTTTGIHTIELQAGNECGISTAITTATITTLPVASAGQDIALCSGGSATIGTASSNYTYSWAPATGLNNPSLPNPTITLTYNGPSADTTIQYVLTVSAGSNCASTDTVLVTVKKLPTVTISPDAASICVGAVANLQAAGADTYVWSPATGLNTTTGNNVIASPQNSTTYTVTGTQNGCSADAQTTIAVTQFLPVDAGNDTTVCIDATAVQLGGTPSGGVWTGSAFVTGAGVFNAQNAGLGTFKLYYTAGIGNCTKTDSLEVMVINPPTVNAGQDTTVCQSNNSIFLIGNPAGGSWSGSTLISPNGAFTPSAAGTYQLQYTFGSGTCIQSDVVQVTVLGAITGNVISGSSSICSGATPNPLTGVAPTGGGPGAPIYQWQDSTAGGLWQDIQGANTIDYAPTAITETYWYRRVVTTNLCFGPERSISNVVSVVINQDATALFTPTKTLGCAPFALTPAVINLTLFNDWVSEYRWYVDGSYIGSGENFPGYTITGSAATATIKLVAISRYGCKDDSIEHSFATVEIPTPSFTADKTEGCGPLTVSFSNTTPNAAAYSYIWDFGNGQTSNAVQPGAVTFDAHPLNADTIYTVLFKTITACDTIVQALPIIVHAAPKALFTPDKSTGCSPFTVQFRNTSRGLNNRYEWDFGDGSPVSISTDLLVSHTFIVSRRDTFNVRLKASNNCGTDELVYAIIVSPNAIQLDFAVNGTDQKGCAPHTTRFINNTKGATSFKWEFGDGTDLLTTKNIDTVVHRYSQPGSYQVRLTATNGCSDTTTTEIISVYESPMAKFTANTPSLCIGDTLRLTNESTSASSYLWSFGDGTTSSLANPVHHFSNAGNYTIRLISLRPNEDGGTCTDTAVQSVTILSTQAGTIIASDTVGTCPPFSVQLKNGNTPAASVLWEFSEGTNASTNETSVTYAKAGSYGIKLTTVSPGGCTYVSEKTILVKGPSGTFSYDGGFHCGDEPVQFTVNSTGADSVQYHFGDGTSLTTTSNLVYHRYQNGGAYLPSVTLLNKEGCAIPLKGIDTIRVDVIRPGFITKLDNRCGATDVQFSDTSFAFYGIASLNWDLGDAGTSTVPVVQHTYNTTSTYTISLDVKSNSGCSSKISKEIPIQVYSQPVASIKAVNESCSDYVVTFSGDVQSTDEIRLNKWTVSNGASGSTNPFTAKFAKAGNYTASYIVGTVNGCYDTVQHDISIKPSPIVVATEDATICLGGSTALQAGGAASLSWLPVSGLSCTQCSNPVASPSATTTYIVQGTAANGCSDWDTVLVQVIQPLQLTVSASDSICIGESSQLVASGAASYRWSPAAGLSSTSVPNPLAKPSATTRYQVVGYDGYQCFTDTAYILVAVGDYPKINLGPDVTLSTGTQHPLLSSVVNGPISKWSWSPATDLNCSDCPQPVATVKKDISYIATITNIYGCSASDTVSIKAFCENAQVFVPNAFTPDGDGVNDVLMVRGKGIAMVKTFRVFNRWGEVVFEKSGFAPNELSNGWNGIIRGVIGGPDVYVYTVEAVCENGTTYSYKGNVSLLK